MDCPNCKFKIDDGSAVCPFCAFVLPKPVQDPNSVGAPVGGAASGAAPLPDIEIVESPGDKPEFQPPAQATVDPVVAPKKSGGLLWLAAAIGIGYGVWYHLLPMLNPAPPPPETQAQRKEEPPKPPPLPAEEKPAPAETKPAEELPKPAAKPAPEPPKPASPWEFEGQVYDVVTLQPVPGVDMTFVSDENSVAVKTGKDGRFKVRLPPLANGGYRLVTDHADYAEEYFDESVANYRRMPAQKRLQLRSINPKHPAWLTAEGVPLKRNVALFPLAPDQ